MKKESKWIFIVLSFSLLLGVDSVLADENANEKTSPEFFKRFSVALLKNPPKNLFHVKQNTTTITKDHLEEMLRGFVRAGLPNRMVGGVGHNNAQKFLLDSLLKIDPEKKGLTYVDSFMPAVSKAESFYSQDFKEKVVANHKPNSEIYLKGQAYTDSRLKFLKEHKETLGKNIIWEKRGSVRPDEVLIITAHYDSLALDKDKLIRPGLKAPGADDNGSGVAIALCLIKLFVHLDVPVTVRVVFLDWEEFAGLGSFAFVEKYQKELSSKKVLGLINLESLGHDSKVKDKEGRYGNMRIYISRPGSEYYAKEKAFADDFLERAKKVTISAHFKIVSNEEPLEGNLGQWQKEWPGLNFSQNWQDDPNYQRIHSSDDFVETLNFRTLYNSYKFIAGGLQSVFFLP